MTNSFSLRSAVGFMGSVCLVFSVCAEAEEKTRLDEVLSAGMAAEVSGFDAGKAEKEYVEDAKRPQTEVLTFSWDNGRKRKAGAFELPVRDTVKFGWVRKSGMSAMEGKAEDPAIKDFIEKVEGVGEFALWNSRDKQLIVLSGGKEFSVWVDVSADAAVNREKSLALAKGIVGKL